MKWPHRYRPSHGPQVWPWWRLLTISIVRCGPGDPVRYFWIKGIHYNAWFYTRWGAWCLTITERNGVYRKEEIAERGWFE
jgi:hypothetical protein